MAALKNNNELNASPLQVDHSRLGQTATTTPDTSARDQVSVRQNVLSDGDRLARLAREEDEKRRRMAAIKKNNEPQASSLQVNHSKVDQTSATMPRTSARDQVSVRQNVLSDGERLARLAREEDEKRSRMAEIKKNERRFHIGWPPS